ncbi:hypothetical protein ACOME3_006747 [Neoechinorhynchus agilis]
MTMTLHRPLVKADISSSNNVVKFIFIRYDPTVNKGSTIASRKCNTGCSAKQILWVGTKQQGKFQQTPQEYYRQIQRMPMNAELPTDVHGYLFCAQSTGSIQINSPGYYRQVKIITTNARMPTTGQGGYLMTE